MSFQLDREFLQGLLDEREKTQQNDERNFEWYSIPSEAKRKVTLRILPPVQGAKAPGFIVRKHYNLPGDSKSFLCFKTHKLDCPICNVLQQYENLLDLKSYVATAKSYFNILVLEDPTYLARQRKVLNPSLVHLGGFPESFFYWLINNLLDKNMSPYLLDPIRGNNISMYRDVLNGKVEKTFAMASTPIAQTQGEIDQILASLYNMEEIWRYPDDVYLNKAKDISFILENELKIKAQSRNTMPAAPNYSVPPNYGMPINTPNQQVYTHPQIGDIPPYGQINQGGLYTPPRNPQVQQDNSTYQNMNTNMHYYQLNGNEVPNTGIINNAPSIEVPQQPVQAQAQVVPQNNIPSGYPSCYGDKNTYNGQDAKCQCRVCTVEFQCTKVILRGGN